VSDAIERVRERVRYFQEGKRVVQNVTFYQDDVAELLAEYDRLRALVEPQHIVTRRPDGTTYCPACDGIEGAASTTRAGT